MDLAGEQEAERKRMGYTLDPNEYGTSPEKGSKAAVKRHIYTTTGTNANGKASSNNTVSQQMRRTATRAGTQMSAASGEGKLDLRE